MAFIRRSGIARCSTSLRRHCERGRPLRVLTTTYTGSTERRALDALSDLGADVRVSYDISTTRLHAKAWLFHRRSGFSTAYIGSSNLTHSAQVSGLEWNVRVSAARNPDVIDKFAAVFESYWKSGDFVPYDRDAVRQREPRSHRQPDLRSCLSPIELRPRAVPGAPARADRAVTRAAATIATCSSPRPAPARPSWRPSTTRACETLPRVALLFVAHREEILDQSLATFRHALRDASFGELWVGGSAPAPLRPRLRLDPEPQRRRPRRRSSPITSTS